MAKNNLYHQAVFGPEELAKMAEAFERAIAESYLTDRSDPRAERFAVRILQIAAAAETDIDGMVAFATQDHHNFWIWNFTGSFIDKLPLPIGTVATVPGLVAAL